MFLEISQISQENTCARASFLIKLQAWGNKEATFFKYPAKLRCTDLLLTNSQSTFKDTHRENNPSNKTGALTKSMNIYIWVICILNQLFIRDSYTQIEFSGKWSSRWQKPILCDVVHFIPPFSVSLHWLLAGQFCMKMLRFHS